MPELPETLSDPRLASFVAAAEAYGALVEQFASYQPAVLLPALHRCLVGLYAAVLALPDRDALMGDDVGDAPDPDITASAAHRVVLYPLISSEARHALAGRIAAHLGPADAYLTIITPAGADPEIVEASLAQDLTLIHQDLRAGLSTWETQGLAFGLWHWRTFFEASWNRALGDALRALEVLARQPGGHWPVGVVTHG
jgi:Domain of unknown function (DUF5063)